MLRKKKNCFEFFNSAMNNQSTNSILKDKNQIVYENSAFLIHNFYIQKPYGFKVFEKANHRAENLNTKGI